MERLNRNDRASLETTYKRDPRVFDLYAYCLTFGFCDSGEKAELYAHLLAAWRWGRKAARANRENRKRTH